MGLTSKPCPGCGAEGYRHRETGKVCGKCQRDLANWKRHQQKLEDLKASDETVNVWSNTNFYSQPSYHVLGAYFQYNQKLEDFGFGDRSLRRPDIIQIMLHRLLEEIAPVVDGYGYMELEYLYNRKPYRPHEFACVRAIKQRHLDILRVLDEAIDGALQEAYGEGFRNGQSILHQLADGSMSIAELNEKTTRGY